MNVNSAELAKALNVSARRIRTLAKANRLDHTIDKSGHYSFDKDKAMHQFANNRSKSSTNTKDNSRKFTPRRKKIKKDIEEITPITEPKIIDISALTDPIRDEEVDITQFSDTLDADCLDYIDGEYIRNYDRYVKKKQGERYAIAAAKARGELIEQKIVAIAITTLCDSVKENLYSFSKRKSSIAVATIKSALINNPNVSDDELTSMVMNEFDNDTDLMLKTLEASMKRFLSEISNAK